ncbi:hypothetical protein F5H01DRAFT_114037 [Linnemannia elongata]|nr:hypothetical protein F5H01DRAFT_114037 [Linnemannia elongata]
MVAFAEFNALCTSDVDCNTDAGEHCIKVAMGQIDTYHCLTFPLPEAESNRLTNGRARVGNLRECNVPERKGCLSNYAIVESPENCCTQQMYVQYGSSVKRFDFACVSGYLCDASDGCRANIDCPDTQLCIDQKCGYAKAGVDFGEDGKPPLKNRCCDSGVVGHDGMCSTTMGGCNGDSDCMGMVGGESGLYCKGQCIRRGDNC